MKVAAAATTVKLPRRNKRLEHPPGDPAHTVPVEPSKNSKIITPLLSNSHPFSTSSSASGAAACTRVNLVQSRPFAPHSIDRVVQLGVQTPRIRYDAQTSNAIPPHFTASAWHNVLATANIKARHDKRSPAVIPARSPSRTILITAAHATQLVISTVLRWRRMVMALIRAVSVSKVAEGLHP